jgi:methionyl-tRNA formyltransferase
MSLRLIFMGTPDFAVPTLKESAAVGHRIVAVYTRAPKPAGRGMAVEPTPVAREAERLGIPVFAPDTLKRPDAESEMRAHNADAAVVVAYGLILPKAILDVPRLGAFNLHASLLPRWRGAAPINRAIMAGDAETGVMVMKMDAGLDTGPVAMAERLPVAADATAGDLHDELARRGGGLMVQALAELERGSLVLTPQAAEGATYANKIAKSETRIRWEKPWQDVHNHIRGLSPFPGAWFEFKSGDETVRAKVLRSTRCEGAGAAGQVLDDRLTVACGEGAVRILQLQRAGRQAMTAEEFLRGTPVAAGTRVG